MNNKEFEQFVLDNGKEILRFCRMTCADREAGDELYQDTMLKLLSKMRSLDLGQNVRSYALSVSILLWKNKKKKYANRNRLIPMESMDRLEAEGNLEIAGLSEASPENCILMEDERIVVQQVVARLPEKYRIPVDSGNCKGFADTGRNRQKSHEQSKACIKGRTGGVRI